MISVKKKGNCDINHMFRMKRKRARKMGTVDYGKEQFINWLVHQ